MPPPVQPLRWHVLASLVLMLIDGAATLALLLLCYFLYRAYRLTRSQLFFFFLLGFGLLAAGETARMLLLAAAFLARAPLLAFFLAHGFGPAPLLLQTAALLLIAVGYAVELAQLRCAREQAEPTAALIPLLPLFALQRVWGGLFLTLAFVNIALSLFILLNAVSVHLSTKSTNSILPVVAFTMLLLSNVLLPLSVISGSEELFVASKALYLFGLLSFLALAARVARA
ncbi:MAG: hypothetical protein QXL64_04960 [Thermofilaceae archaeon]